MLVPQAFAASAAINWLLKDGVSRIVRMAVSTSFGQTFDADLKVRMDTITGVVGGSTQQHVQLKLGMGPGDIAALGKGFGGLCGAVRGTPVAQQTAGALRLL